MKKFHFLTTEYELKKIIDTVYAGELHGFNSVISITGKHYYSLSIGLKCTNVKELMMSLKNMSEFKKLKFSIKNSKLTVTLKIPFFSSSCREKFVKTIDILFPFLKNNGCINGSFLSGESNKSLKLCQVGGEYVYITEMEFENYQNEKIALKNKSENIIFGIIGVLGVSIVAIITYIFIGRMGYYSFPVSIGICPVSCIAYKKLAGKISKKSFIIIFIILLLSLFIATFLEYSWYAYDVFDVDIKNGYMSFSDLLRETKIGLYEVSDFRNSFMEDVSINGLFLIVISIVSFIKIYSEEYEVRKVY